MDMYRGALYIVDPGACNASGIICDLARWVKDIGEECGDQGTAAFNSHPVLVLAVSQLAQLTRCMDPAVWSNAYRTCRQKVQESDGQPA